MNDKDPNKKTRVMRYRQDTFRHIFEYTGDGSPITLPRMEQYCDLVSQDPENAVDEYRFRTPGYLFNRTLQANWLRNFLQEGYIGADRISEFHEIKPSRLLTEREQSCWTKSPTLDALLKNYGEFCNEQGTSVLFHPHRHFVGPYPSMDAQEVYGLDITITRNPSRTSTSLSDFNCVVERLDTLFIHKLFERVIDKKWILVPESTR